MVLFFVKVLKNIKEIKKFKLKVKTTGEINYDFNIKYHSISKKFTLNNNAKDQKGGGEVALIDGNIIQSQGAIRLEINAEGSVALKNEDFKHKTIKEVFNMEQAYMLYPKVDATKTKGNEIKNISGQNIDFEYGVHGKDSIDLNLNYLYNKNFDTQAADWIDDVLDKLWLTRYVFNTNNVAQSYFVPVATCRYPNQMVKVDVYPDFRWRIKFKFSSEKLHVKRESHFNKRGQEKISRQAHWKKFTLGDREYKFSVDTAFWYNDKKNQITLKRIPLENELKLLIWAFKIARKLTFSDETDNFKKHYAKKPKKNESTAITITVGVPTIEGVVHGGYTYGEKQKHSVGLQHKYGVALQWTITGSLNLLYFAKYLGPAGAAVTGIKKVVQKLQWLSNNKLNIDFGIDLFASLDINTRGSYTTHTIDPDAGEVKLKLRVKIGLKIYVSAAAQLDDVVIYAGLEAGLEAWLKVEITYNANMDKPKLKGKFEGLFAKAKGVIGTKDEDNKKREISFSIAETLLGPETFILAL